MALPELRGKIELEEARLAVIGLGYVGLPVACQFAQAGFDVIGVELPADRVEMLNSGLSPIDGYEPGLPALLADVIERGKLRATTDYRDLHDCEVILIAVETPVDEHNIPHYE